MKRYVYSSIEGKFLSEIKLKIQQPSLEYRADEVERKLSSSFSSRSDLVNYYFSKKLFKLTPLLQKIF